MLSTVSVPIRHPSAPERNPTICLSPPESCSAGKAGESLESALESQALPHRRLSGISVAFAAKFKGSSQAQSFRQQRRTLGPP